MDFHGVPHGHQAGPGKTLIMKKKKLGRNDPCPCGSGKKYKKCCLGKPPVPPLSDYMLSKKPFIEQKTRNRISLEKRNALSPTMVKMQPKRRKHHYVPVWFQKRFLPEGQTSLYYLNLQPFEQLPDGRQIKVREMYEWGPRNCFYRKGLYTIKVFGIRNDEIEEFLFGKIDNDGACAINALSAKNFKVLSDYFQKVFEYMDAQKLRTPKGLDWIRSNYFQLSHLELMLEMQSLRTMHCTMWVEGVMEIVSAKDSDIKFIISDHPVTIYNPACPPNAKICQYPNEPPTAWKASQTIFPLDLNHCFILTNLEYARDPDGVDSVSSRTNPRHFAETITRWDTVIRDRRLKPEEVCAINYIVKTRARKYVAAAQLEWLYPEKWISHSDWESLRKVPLPPKKETWRFGGEIYVGGKDGGLAWYQDAFGRRHTSHENKDDPVRQYSIKRRIQILFDAIGEIFGFSKGKDWDDFRRELTDDKIKELYGVVGGLWNPDTEIMSLLPRPSDQLSAFYSGTIDPRVVPLTVVGYSLYVDKIIMISPFPNPRVMNKEYSPYYSPSQYRNDTIKNILLMMQIMPLIEADIVEMIPDPCDFDPFFRKRIYEMAKARMQGRGPSQEDIEQGTNLMRDDFKNFMFSLPPENLKSQMKKALPDLSEEELENAVEYTQKMRLENPLMPLSQEEPGKVEGQLQIARLGGNLEMALYLAQATGSFVFTDVNFRWREVQSAELKRPGEEEDWNPWIPLIKALDSLHLTMYLDPDPNFWHKIKEKGVLEEFKSLFRRICTSVRNIKDAGAAFVEAKRIASLIKDVDIKSMFDAIDKDYEKFSRESTEKLLRYKVRVPATHLIPANGLSSNSVTQILLTHGSNTPYWGAVPFGAFLDLKNMAPVQ